MSKFPRETIFFVSAIVGANLLGIVTQQPKPVRSFDCNQPLQSFLPKPSEPAQGEPIGSFWDVRKKRDAPLYRPGEAPAVPHIRKNGAWVQAQAYGDQNNLVAAAPPQPVDAATLPAPLPATRTEVSASAAAIAHERQNPGLWVLEGRAPYASEQADYEARRLALMVPRGGL